MGGILLAVVVWVVPVLAVVGILFLRKPLRRRLFAGTGLAEWQRTAKKLSWRDRVTLERANSRGRVTTLELASLAVQRGRTMSALVKRTQTSPWLRRANGAAGAFIALAVVGNVALLLTGNGDGNGWLIVLLGTAMAVLLGAMPALQRRQLKMFGRSVELNEALLDRPPPPTDL